MPLYEYECAKCGERTEAIQRTDDPLLTVCPACGGALKKLLSAPAFKFKGSGFYVTDYGKGGAKTGEKTEEKEKIPAKGEEGKGTPGGASSGGEAGSSGASDSSKDSSKGKKEGAPDAAPPSPAAQTAPAPSKKKNGDKK